MVLKLCELATNLVVSTPTTCMERAPETSDSNCLLPLEQCLRLRILTYCCVHYLKEESVT